MSDWPRVLRGANFFGPQIANASRANVSSSFAGTACVTQIAKRPVAPSLPSPFGRRWHEVPDEGLVVGKAVHGSAVWQRCELWNPWPPHLPLFAWRMRVGPATSPSREKMQRCWCVGTQQPAACHQASGVGSADKISRAFAQSACICPTSSSAESNRRSPRMKSTNATSISCP